ncbi:AfsR/SARP family transcriptional regulator [Desulfitobacterium hafniense]|uniref:Bacterial transcriptional activator domain-containing protein n=4 Tax=root TaxID=1 RepID=Q24Y40_DESHY|nr:BTAD domain-containing putative transcriptional regulator [Desulfitobacterium hafniense]ACL20391.1 transcriptional regulator, SARP family [Desulfitobacterium hafniense DCB-2]KTE90588.1 hypothetical protein AT727_08335 [Desulfitobacterium hafniense]MEA5021596.1 BTAD domain-containing putative transcriptional regulator [Desulfitobacterium hafniense]CDX01197.1 Tetratricopeptide repeat protein [Desulfitobacterium hafniense]BAE83052.1 hypothetical protein DSY1263 [Desulfitobacterium hafniense Y5
MEDQKNQKPARIPPPAQRKDGIQRYPAGYLLARVGSQIGHGFPAHGFVPAQKVFEDACLKLGVLYAGQGETVQAEEILRRALAMDPYSESICLELLRLLMAQGMRSKALCLYNRFQKNFEQELGIKIDGRLTEAVHPQSAG